MSTHYNGVTRYLRLCNDDRVSTRSDYAGGWCETFFLDPVTTTTAGKLA